MKLSIDKRRPALRYHGGKWMIAPWIISHFPHHKVYTEVFGGGGSILLRKPRAYAEIYNDIDSEIVNVFIQLRDNGKKLKEYLRLTPFSREVFIDSYSQTKNPLIKAAKTIIKSFMGFGSDAIRAKSGFRSNSNRSGTTPAHDWANYVSNIDFFVERLRGVVIECHEASCVLKAHDSEETLHYVDPPYVHSTRTSDKRYVHEMTDKQHIELAKVLKSLKGKVILSGYHSPLYDKLYGDWRMEEKETFADGARKRIEVLWFNYTDNSRLL